MIGPGALPTEALAAPEPVIAVGIPVRDTCKEVRDGLVYRTIPRETLVDLSGAWLVSRAALANALDRVGATATGPLQLFSTAGLPIRVITRG